MSRFAGYVGAMSFLGSRLTAPEEALEEVARRGFRNLHDGGTPRSPIAAARAGATAAEASR